MIALVLAASAYNPMGTCGGSPTHWTDTSPWMLTKPNGSNMYSGLSDAEVENAMDLGFDVWRDTVTCCSDFTHEYLGTTPSYYSTNDNNNVISFEENNWDWTLGSVNGVIAITFVQWAGGCALTDGDQIYNGVGFNFTTSGSSGTDLQSISAHENGHWVGLDHTSASGATMQPNYPGGTSFRSLADDDEAGVCNAHPGICDPQEEECADGIDDDSDGLTDCADPDCASFQACSCAVQAEVGCDNSVSSDTFGAANSVESWGCADWQTDGPEAVYSFTPTVSGSVTVTLSGLSADLDLFVTSEGSNGNCDPNACNSSGSPNSENETVTFDGTAGETYVVVADGYDGAASAFTIDVDCPFDPNPPPPDDPTDPTDPIPPGPTTDVCLPIGALTCGQPITGTNEGRPSDVDLYSCTPAAATGPEAVYTLTPSVDGPVTIDLSDLTGNLNLFVTGMLDGGCDADTCGVISDGADTSAESVTFQGEAGRTYGIVADGFGGATSSFTLLATCAGSEIPDGSDPVDPEGGTETVPFRQTGCGCNTPTPAPWFALPLALLALRRRG